MEPLRRRAALHCLQGLAGLRPLEPGFKRVEIRPQLGGLEELELIAHTVRGPLHFSVRGPAGARDLNIKLPPDCEGEFILPQQESVSLDRIAGPRPQRSTRATGCRAGTNVHLRLSSI